MRLIVKILFIYVITTACSNNQTALNENSTSTPQLDSIYGFKIGDSFIHDSSKTYSFILVKIEPEILYFLPVKIDTSGNDINNILNGQIRMVPASVMNPDNGEYGVECIGAMGKEDRNDFKRAISIRYTGAKRGNSVDQLRISGAFALFKKRK